MKPRIKWCPAIKQWCLEFHDSDPVLYGYYSSMHCSFYNVKENAFTVLALAYKRGKVKRFEESDRLKGIFYGIYR